MGISRKVERSLSGSSFIRKMFEEGERLRKIYGFDKVYDFTIGNPNVEPPERFREELKRLALNPVPGMHRYMSNAGYPETRAAVAEALISQTGLAFNADHIIMTTG
ncbi:MAG: pyridoxal phosphate-dependent aminotransferase, partial [Actinobacteria bacterium]|nr:pyridoxal phosphate-dependent aminotransferase [Actinomycetota bacterium]